MKTLAASDLKDQVYSDIFISFDTPEMYVGDETPGPIPKSSKQAPYLSISDFQKKFAVSDDVARRLVEYQNDIQEEFLLAIERMNRQAGRYLAVKPYFTKKQYDVTMLDNYIYREDSDRDLNPQNYVLKAVRNVVISFTLLAITILFVRSSTFDVGIDPLGGWILGLIWGGTTLLIMLGIPKGYRTRKLLYSLEKRVAAQRNH